MASWIEKVKTITLQSEAFFFLPQEDRKGSCTETRTCIHFACMDAKRQKDNNGFNDKISLTEFNIC